MRNWYEDWESHYPETNVALVTGRRYECYNMPNVLYVEILAASISGKEGLGKACYEGGKRGDMRMWYAGNHRPDALNKEYRP